MIAKAMAKVGNEGVITVEEAKTAETELDVVEGMQFDRGYLSPYFITNADKMEVELEDPSSCCTRRSSPRCSRCCRCWKPWSSRAAAADHRRGHRRRSPGHPGGQQAARRPEGRRRQGSGLRRSPQGHAGRHRHPDRRPGHLEDLGIKLENVTLDMLGKAKKVTITKDDTTIVDGAGKKADIEAASRQIKRQIEDTTSDYDKEKLQERLAKLAGGVAVIRVGGATEVEVKEKKDRVDDALNATRAAVEEGIVPGGGVALLKASKKILDG
jgi:chaperonin GroEL